MYYGKKKGIIIGIVVAVVVVVLAIVGVILATQTDMFKSNKTLFWKYATSIAKDENLTFSQITDAINTMEETPYTINGELTCSTDDSDLSRVLDLIKVKTQVEQDKTNNYAHANGKLLLSNENLIDFDVVQNNNVLAIKSDEIVTSYLGIRNENLKVLEQKLGITGVDIIPNEINGNEVNDYSQLTKLTEDEKTHLLNTYQPIIVDNIPDSNYTKQTQAVIKKDGTSYTTTAYRLDLSAQEVQDIYLRILETLREDDTTLDIIYQKELLLGIDEASVSKEALVNEIDNMIDNVQNVEFKDLSFVVYNYKGINLATEILVKNETKYTIFKDIGRVIIDVEDLSGNSDVGKLTFDVEYKTTATQISVVVKVIKDELEMFTLNISNSGAASQGQITTDINVSFIPNEDSEAYEFNYTQELEFVDQIENIVKLDETNCAVLNDYTQEQLQGLVQALTERIGVVITEKGQVFSNLIENSEAMNRAQQNNELTENQNTDMNTQQNMNENTQTNTQLQNP